MAFSLKGRVAAIIKDASQRRKLLLTLNEARDILLAYGIPVIRTGKAFSEEEAIRISAEIGSGLAKVDSSKVFLSLREAISRSPEGVVEAFRRLRASAAGWRP